MSDQRLRTRFFVVDAFTSSEYPELKGNPAGVLISTRPLEDDVAIEIARRLALPALAIISDPGLFNSTDYPHAHADLPIAWLGPEGTFLPLCGHATMATSLVLFDLFPAVQELNLVARSGKKIHVARAGKGATIAFPALPTPTPAEVASCARALQVLSTAASLQESDVLHVAESRADQTAHPNLLVELKQGFDLQGMSIDPKLLVQLPYRGVWLVTAGPKHDSSIDMQTRVFFPSIGLLEDHVCGSAHTLFMPYWASKYAVKAGQEEEVSLVSRQVSPRGGLLKLRWNNKWGSEDGICWLTGEGIIQDMGALDV
ncbi:Diaminopimelate epimerase-like protein [Cystobasidium minutum MCA 4210]|uniref:Diaminopimelate epimerase-like protein n=1 Tax=Cystobasidium minutum MCA 4210 TaxID=1397322 RepID=UPI0034D00121|eukprot:jgi/Rhomi1/65678/CE65677_2823